MKIDSGLPFNLKNLINLRTIENHRVEFKANWDHKTAAAVVETVCAFANDLLNLNGGYIILGIEEENGQAILPPRGLKQDHIDRIQKEIYGTCKSIVPEFQPLIFPEYYQNQFIIIIWVPGGDNRPYQAPNRRKNKQRDYFVRQGSQTVVATGEILRQLFELTAKVPYDDRRNFTATIDEISPTLVHRFLYEVESDLFTENYTNEELYLKLEILKSVNGHKVPRNVGLLFFNETPEKFFPGAQIEVVQFADNAGGDLIEEQYFKGPLVAQIKAVLTYLENLNTTLIRKIPGQAKAERIVAIPYEAIKEAIVNAVYHRSYEAEFAESIKIYLYPDKMVITSYPGPMPGIKIEDIKQGKILPQIPARNRRIGNFLKDLKLAERRGTGIPKIQRKMRQNGSPSAEFRFDEQCSYFEVTLPVHPRFLVRQALNDANYHWATGEKTKGFNILKQAFYNQPASGALASQLIEYAFVLHKEAVAKEVMAIFEQTPVKNEAVQPYLSMARLLIDRRNTQEASEILERMPPLESADDLAQATAIKEQIKNINN
jgi:ATP-dependent DNA helicase RecG